MGYPQISIVSIFLNDEKMLKIVTNSILSQTYPNIQHIISIGKSHDGSAELLKSSEARYAQAGKKLTWTNKPDTCIAEAYNNCFELIDKDSEYVLILSNPYISSNSLKIQMGALLSGGYDGLFCGAIMQKDGKIIRKLSGGGSPKHWRLGWQGTTESFIFSKQLLDETGFFDVERYAHTFGEDYDFFLRIVMNKKWKLGSLKKPIVNYIGGGISNSRNLELVKSFYNVLKDKKVKFAWITVAGKCLRVLCRGMVLHTPVPLELRIEL